MKYRKPALIISVIAVAVVIVAGVLLLGSTPANENDAETVTVSSGNIDTPSGENTEITTTPLVNQGTQPSSPSPDTYQPTETAEESPQEQIKHYLSALFDETFSPHYDGLRYEMSQYEETIEGDSYISTFLWTMYNLANGLDIAADFGKEQGGNFYLQVTAMMAGNQLDMATAVVMSDNSFNGPPTYVLPLEEYFPLPPATPPLAFELISDYVEQYMERIVEGDTRELALFILIDGGVQERYVEIAERVIEYYSVYDLVGATVQRVHYFEHETEKQYTTLIRDGNGEMFRINLIYGDGLAGIDVRMFD